MREVATSLGAVFIDSTCGCGAVQHGAMLTSVVGEADPPAAIRGLGDLHNCAEGDGMSPKSLDLSTGQPENNGVTAARCPTVIHTNLAGLLRGQARHKVWWNHPSLLFISMAICTACLVAEDSPTASSTRWHRKPS